jgi:ornithine decarboxylase
MNTVLMDTILQDPTTVTPSLILDFDIIRDHYDRFINSFPGGQVFYAMKANANQQVVQLVVDKHGGLEIASLAELERSLDAGAIGEQIICSNPIKNPVFLARMHQVGVYAMVADSPDELEKIAEYAPGSRIYVRLAVDNHGSVLPLAGKFGVSGEEALALFDQARDLGLQPIGLSFHVGSQCLSVHNWENAIQLCGEVWEAAEACGHDFYFLDIGGGFPAGSYHDEAIPTIEAIGDVTMEAIREYIPDVPNLMLVLEPGRGLTGDSGRLIVTVVGKAKRAGDSWLYLDAGVFNGLMETFEGFPPIVFPLGEAANDRPMVRYTLAGPSCDSCDVVARNLELPEVRVGERLVFWDTGAYTNEYAVAFNGFPIPQCVILNEQPERVMA